MPLCLQGFWTGKLFKTCTGFSTFHGEFEHGEDGMEVYNFCTGEPRPSNHLPNIHDGCSGARARV